MYKAIFHQNNQSEYYCGDELLFIVKRKRLLLGIRNLCNMYLNDDLICKFYSSEFTFLYWKLKILFQKFDKEVILEKKGFKYNLIIDNKRISLIFTNNPFKKTIGKIFLDEKCIGEIEKYEEKSKTYFSFNFFENSGLEYYILVLFSMNSIGITDSI